jgi:hypothetical protein
MPNHVHLVVRSANARISRLMARLGTGYARRFNERHQRVGHLFRNRFRSRRVVDDADLIGLVLYVTRTPLEARLVSDAAALEDFTWCGLGALLGKRAPFPFEAVAETLALFDVEPQRARQRIRDRLGLPPETFRSRGVPRHCGCAHGAGDAGRDRPRAQRFRDRPAARPHTQRSLEDARSRPPARHFNVSKNVPGSGVPGFG